MKKQKNNIPKPILAIIQIGIVIAVVMLFSVINYYFIGFETNDKRSDNQTNINSTTSENQQKDRKPDTDFKQEKKENNKKTKKKAENKKTKKKRKKILKMKL